VASELRRSDDQLATMMENLQVSSVGKSSYYTVSYKSTVPETAMEVANAVVDAFQKLRGDTEDRRRTELKDILTGMMEREKENIRNLKEKLVSLHANLIESDKSVPSLEALGWANPRPWLNWTVSGPPRITGSNY
jgi:uncharacterized protein involved in exopolysaccharide biosynthesis